MNKKVVEYMAETRKMLWGSHNDIPMWKISLLRDMAEREIWPDGTFGDDELIVWSWFHQLYKEVNSE